MNNSIAAAIVVFVMLVGLGAGYMGGSVNTPAKTVTSVTVQTLTSSTTTTVTTPTTTTVTQSVTTTSTQSVTQTVTATVQARSNVVNYVVIPDYGGATFDAFVKDANINGTIPKFGSKTVAPGPYNNTAIVTAGVPITFIITNIDTALVDNFTGAVTTPFTIYNDTDAGQVAVQYKVGQAIRKMAVSHTFTIKDLNISIPIPPDTEVIFTYTFKPGTYTFTCETPCGPGMKFLGYMQGHIVAS